MTWTSDYATGPTDDQLILYDQALLTWLQTDYAIIPGKTPQMLIATPHRGYAEAVTLQSVSQEMMTLPRIALTRGEESIDPERFNPAMVRALGLAGTGRQAKYQGRYPVPILIPYQVDLWSEFVRDMNLWVQKFLYQFAFTYKYFQVYVDSVWGNKKFLVNLEGNLANTSELEPETEAREIRRSASLVAKAWLFDQTPAVTALVKRFLLEVTETDGGTVVETFSPNQHATAWTSPGGQKVFAGGSLSPVPILEDTFVLSAFFGGLERVAQDDGAGHLMGPHVTTGTIDYITGAVAITYDTEPDAGPLVAWWLLKV